MFLWRLHTNYWRRLYTTTNKVIVTLHRHNSAFAISVGGNVYNINKLVNTHVHIVHTDWLSVVILQVRFAYKCALQYKHKYSKYLMEQTCNVHTKKQKNF